MTVVLQISSNEQGAVELYRFSEDATLLEQLHFDTLETVAGIQEGEVVVLAIPSQDVFFAEVELPKMGRNEMRRSVPFALEESLATDVNQLHFALADKAQADKMPVLVVAKKIIQQYLDVLKKQKVRVDAVVPDVYALAETEAGWSVLQQQERVLVRSGQCKGAAVDSDAFDLWAKLMFQQEPPSTVNYHADMDMSAIFAECPSCELHSDNALSLGFSRLIDIDALPCNLLQGEYKPKVRRSKLKRLWRRVIVLAIVWFVIFLAAHIGSYFFFSRENKILRQHINQLTQQVLPGQATNDPRPAVQNELRVLMQRVGDNPFYRVFHLVATQLKQHPQMQLRAYSFNNGQLDLAVNVQTQAMAASLSRDLEGVGLKVTLGKVVKNGKIFTAKIMVQLQ